MKNLDAILEIKSDNYGTYKSELVGVIDFKLVYASIRDSSIWVEKYHYITFFNAVTYVVINPEEHEYLHKVAVYVPVDDINKDWDCTVWHDNYPSIKLSKKLPITIPRKLINKWKTVSNQYLVKDL